MKPGRVIFLNRFYWPNERATAQLLSDLATAIAARGYAVEVVTTRTSAADSRSESRSGVHIHRGRTTHCGAHGLAGRALDFASFAMSAFWHLLWRARPGDIVVAMTDPPLLGVVVCGAARLRQAKIVHWIQDIYPEVAAELTGRRSLLLLRPLRNWSWRRAGACVVPGRDMAAAVTSSGVAPAKLHVSPNWAPCGLDPARQQQIAALREKWNLTGKFVLMYSGNLGRAHELDSLLEVAEGIRNDPAFALVFVGHGARKEALQRAVRERGLPNVAFYPPQPRADLAPSLGVADVHFVTLKTGAERWVFPSKLYGIAKVGRPVIFIGAATSEIAQCVQSAGMGEVFSTTETLRIVARLRTLREDVALRTKLAAAALAFNPHGFEQAADMWCRLLGAELAGSAHSL